MDEFAKRIADMIDAASLSPAEDAILLAAVTERLDMSGKEDETAAVGAIVSSYAARCRKLEGEARLSRAHADGVVRRAKAQAEEAERRIQRASKEAVSERKRADDAERALVAARAEIERSRQIIRVQGSVLPFGGGSTLTLDEARGETAELRARHEDLSRRHKRLVDALELFDLPNNLDEDGARKLVVRRVKQYEHVAAVRALEALARTLCKECGQGMPDRNCTAWLHGTDKCTASAVYEYLARRHDHVVRSRGRP